MVVAYRKQVYADLKKAAIKAGHQFQDPLFPATSASLFYDSDNRKGNGIEWKRPKDICTDPQLFVDGVSSRDLVQGELGNCWFVAACAALAANKGNWTQVIPDFKEQNWAETHHEGIFHFRFWQFGEWVDVVVDDLLPTRDGRLIYVHSPTRNEFWSALLEKAYAKLFGCYEALDGGELSEALEDFTGGVSENFDMVQNKYSENEAKKEEFFDAMRKAIDDLSLLCAAIPAKTPEEMEKPNEAGLIKGHAYSVTAVMKITLAGTGIMSLFKREKLPMIRLRNPWGGVEWTGAFSDGSPQWAKISKSEREKIGLTFENDGEFWMTMDDFCKYFLNLSICHTVNMAFFSLKKRWHEAVFHSEWTTAPPRAGGCINNKATFLNNPQVEGNREYRVHGLPPVTVSSTFVNSRSMLLRHALPKGRYLLVPCTFEPGAIGAFLLRFYTSAPCDAKELTHDKPVKPKFCPCLRSYPVCATQVRVVKAVGLERKNKAGDIDSYCIISCEGEKVRSPIVKHSAAPEWNASAIFYRKSPVKKTILIDVYNSNVGFDEFLGRQVFIAANDCRDQASELPLKTKDHNTDTAGKILVVLTTDHNLDGI